MTGTPLIPYFGVARQYLNLKEELMDAIDHVYKSGQVLDGPVTEQFEMRMRMLANRKYAIAVNSCTQALIFSLKYYQSCRSTPARVLIPSVSFVATINAVIEAGCIPVFGRVNSQTGLLDITQIDLNEVDIVMYVNLCGNIIDYDRLTVMNKFFNRGIPVIEDAAQSFGAYYKDIPSGKLGDISCLSFDPTKNLNNYGSGGMILTDDPDIADAMYDFRDNGKSTYHTRSGTNSKMSESDCAQMIVKLRHFSRWQERRRKIADYFDQHIISQPEELNKDVIHARSKYFVQHTNASDLKLHMHYKGIESKILYPTPLTTFDVAFTMPGDHLLDHFLHERFCETALGIPIYPELTDSEVECIVEGVNSMFTVQY